MVVIDLTLYCIQTILFFCLSSALGSILDRNRDCPSDAVLSKVATDIVEGLNKKNSTVISKTEFLTWVSKSLRGLPDTKCENVFNLICTGLGTGADRETA
jgi:hypothetical protein